MKTPAKPQDDVIVTNVSQTEWQAALRIAGCKNLASADQRKAAAALIARKPEIDGSISLVVCNSPEHRKRLQAIYDTAR